MYISYNVPHHHLQNIRFEYANSKQYYAVGKYLSNALITEVDPDSIPHVQHSAIFICPIPKEHSSCCIVTAITT